MPLTTQEIEEALSDAHMSIDDVSLNLRRGQVCVKSSNYNLLVEAQHTLMANYSVVWGPSASDPCLYVSRRP